MNLSVFSKSIYEFLYKNATISLDRKREIFIKALSKKI